VSDEIAAAVFSAVKDDSVYCGLGVVSAKQHGRGIYKFG